MSVQKWLLLLVNIVIFSTASYAQKGLDRALEASVKAQLLNRAKLPTLRDGMHNFVTGQLGRVPTGVLPSTLRQGYRSWQGAASPVGSVLAFGKPLQKQQPRVSVSPYVLQGRENCPRNNFYEVAPTGKGNIPAIALPAKAFIKEVAWKENMDKRDLAILLRMTELIEGDFKMSNQGNLSLTRSGSFKQVHRQIIHLKQEWPVYSEVYRGTGQGLPAGVIAALDALDIQTWMLEHAGRFPQVSQKEVESSLVGRFEELIDKMANQPVFAVNEAMQMVVQHLVHLRAAAEGTMTPSEVMFAVLSRIEQGGRIPGVSLVQMDPLENTLARELNYLEQLRRANLLHLVVPTQKGREWVSHYLETLQEMGYIYQQMIKIIPEFAYDGVTLNVPTYSKATWDRQLQQWQKERAAAGESQTPRSVIAGRFDLPLNFNDLTAEEQTEVLLGIYLKIN